MNPVTFVRSFLDVEIHSGALFDEKGDHIHHQSKDEHDQHTKLSWIFLLSKTEGAFRPTSALWGKKCCPPIHLKGGSAFMQWGVQSLYCISLSPLYRKQHDPTTLYCFNAAIVFSGQAASHQNLNVVFAKNNSS